MDEPKAFVPAFEHDVFISYARVDNSGDGWVDRFHDQLRFHLGKRVGRLDRVSIWRDEKKLTGNQDFDEVIEKRVRRSAIFLALTSTSYLQSDYCLQEIQDFHAHAEAGEPGLYVDDDRSRILNAVLDNLPIDEWPDQVGRTLGFPFHDADQTDGIVLPIDPDDPQFKNRVWELADAIYKTLQAMRQSIPSSTTEPVAEPKACDVYLAAVADSLKTKRQRLGEELIEKGFVVHHGPPPPYEAAEDHRRTVRELMGEAQLSVHLLDDLPGAEIQEDEPTTYPREQVALGRAHARSQMIWVPADLDLAAIEDECQRRFLNQLENGARDEPYDFFRGSSTHLADDIADKLNVLRERTKAAAAPASVLLDVQGKDESFALQLNQTLSERQILPLLNPQENDPRLDTEILRSRLSRVGALVIVYGHAESKWVQGRLEQAVTIAVAEGYPLRAFCIVLAPPDDNKADLQPKFPFLNLHLVDNRQGFDPSALEPLFADLTGGSQ